MAAVDDSSRAQHQLDSVLSNLYDFGEEFVTHEDNIPEHGEANGPTEEKEAEKVNDITGDEQPLVSSRRRKRNASMFFDSIKDELCSQARNPPAPSSSVGKPSSVEVVTFVGRKDKNQSKDKNNGAVNTEKNTDETEEDYGQEFDFEKVRLEVHKFGITGYKKDVQRKFEQERAIMLGAKAPKREYVNYKLYQKQIKEKGQGQKAKNVKENGLEPVKKKQKQGKNNRRSKKTAPSGQVGRFRDGALILSGKDIEKIKKSKMIK